MPTATAPAKKRVAKKAPPPPVKVSVNHRGQIQVRLPQALIDRLDAEAERRRVSKTYLVEQMITSSLARWEDQDIAAL